MSATVAIAGGTKIEWCDFTFNPWWGCERVSPGCARCYADTLARRRQPGVDLWGAGHGFRFFGDAHWAEPLRWARTAPGKLGRRPRVFCASMADVFEDRPELEEPRDRVFALIEETAELDWLILTKRPEHAARWLDGSYGAEIPGNVWLGVSIENARFAWRADVLREIPAAVRFVSAEPLLGSLFEDSSEWARKRRRADSMSVVEALLVEYDDVLTPAEVSSLVHRTEARSARRYKRPLNLTGISWVIVGGESGHGARPMHVGWALELVHQCREHGVAPFVKQLGAVWAREHGGDAKGGDWTQWPPRLRVREFPNHERST